MQVILPLDLGLRIPEGDPLGLLIYLLHGKRVYAFAFNITKLHAKIQLLHG